MHIWKIPADIRNLKILLYFRITFLKFIWSPTLYLLVLWTNKVLYLPEPHYLFAISCIMAINSVSLPVRHINLLHSTKHNLEKFTKFKITLAWVFWNINYFSIYHFIALQDLSALITEYSYSYLLVLILIVEEFYPLQLKNLTSSSFSSKYCSHWRGTTSLNPSKKALVCSCTPRENRHSAIKLKQKKYYNSENNILYFKVYNAGVSNWRPKSWMHHM